MSWTIPHSSPNNYVYHQNMVVYYCYTHITWDHSELWTTTARRSELVLKFKLVECRKFHHGPMCISSSIQNDGDDVWPRPYRRMVISHDQPSPFDLISSGVKKVYRIIFGIVTMYTSGIQLCSLLNYILISTVLSCTIPIFQGYKIGTIGWWLVANGVLQNGDFPHRGHRYLLRIHWLKHAYRLWSCIPLGSTVLFTSSQFFIQFSYDQTRF